MYKKIKLLCLCVILCIITGCQQQKNKESGYLKLTGLVTLDVSKENTVQEDVADNTTDKKESDGTENTQDSKGNHSDTSSNNGQTSTDKNATTKDTNSTSEIEAKPVVETVTITVECKTILKNKSNVEPGYAKYIPEDGIVIPSVTIEIKNEMTVLEVLEAACEEYEYKLVAQNGYVISIENVSEKCCGQQSGWMYSVNDAYVNKGASKKVVSAGDTIKWMFTCAGGKDLYFK